VITTLQMNMRSLSWASAKIILLFAVFVPFCWGGVAGKAAAPRDGTNLDGALLGVDMAKWMNDDLDHSLPLVETLKVKWVRFGIAWERIEPSPGRYDWEQLDRIVNETARHRLHLLVTLRALNSWAGTHHAGNSHETEGHQAATPPKDLAQFARFVGAIAGRYKGHGVCWQIENEPNLDVYWLGTREDYVHLLKTAYAAIHKADPAATVVSAGIACEFFENLGAPEQRLAHLKPWFDAVLESKAFDAVDMHNYFIPEEGNPWGITFGGYIRTVKGWMKDKGVRTPLWITEFAFSSGPLTVRQKTLSFDAGQQSRFLDHAVAEAKTEGVQHLFWMFLRDTEDGQGNRLGLTARDGKTKEAWNQFVRLAED